MMHQLGSNNAFDTYMLPKDLLLDGATSWQSTTPLRATSAPLVMFQRQ